MTLIDVIKYEGGNNVLVWKHPKEDFNTSAQLIVHESQEAVVFKDGIALGPYSAGKHTLETENIDISNVEFLEIQIYGSWYRGDGTGLIPMNCVADLAVAK